MQFIRVYCTRNAEMHMSKNDRECRVTYKKCYVETVNLTSFFFSVHVVCAHICEQEPVVCIKTMSLQK